MVSAVDEAAFTEQDHQLFAKEPGELVSVLGGHP